MLLSSHKDRLRLHRKLLRGAQRSFTFTLLVAPPGASCQAIEMFSSNTVKAFICLLTQRHSFTCRCTYHFNSNGRARDALPLHGAKVEDADSLLDCHFYPFSTPQFFRSLSSSLSSEPTESRERAVLSLAAPSSFSQIT